MVENDKDKALLKQYLAQYHRAKERKQILRDRLREITAELNSPSFSSKLDAMPRGRKRHDAPASLAIKMDEIQGRIQRQAEIEATAIIDVMNIIEYLPAGSTERMIMELRHIDCRPWSRPKDCSGVMEKAHLTRTPCFDYYNRGLTTLLGYKKVRKALGEFTEKMARLERDGG